MANSFDMNLLNEADEALKAIIDKDEYKNMVVGMIVIPLYSETIDADKVAPGSITAGENIADSEKGPNMILNSINGVCRFMKVHFTRQYHSLATELGNILNSRQDEE